MTKKSDCKNHSRNTKIMQNWEQEENMFLPMLGKQTRSNKWPKKTLLFTGISLPPPFFFQRSTTSLQSLLTGWWHTRLKIYIWQLHRNLSLFTPKLFFFSFFFFQFLFLETTLIFSNINCKIKEHVYRNWCISHCQTWWNGCLCLFVLHGNFPASSWFFHVEMTSLETRKDQCTNIISSIFHTSKWCIWHMLIG